MNLLTEPDPDHGSYHSCDLASCGQVRAGGLATAASTAVVASPPAVHAPAVIIAAPRTFNGRMGEGGGATLPATVLAGTTGRVNLSQIRTDLSRAKSWTITGVSPFATKDGLFALPYPGFASNSSTRGAVYIGSLADILANAPGDPTADVPTTMARIAWGWWTSLNNNVLWTVGRGIDISSVGLNDSIEFCADFGPLVGGDAYAIVMVVINAGATTMTISTPASLFHGNYVLTPVNTLAQAVSLNYLGVPSVDVVTVPPIVVTSVGSLPAVVVTSVGSVGGVVTVAPNGGQMAVHEAGTASVHEAGTASVLVTNSGAQPIPTTSTGTVTLNPNVPIWVSAFSTLASFLTVDSGHSASRAARLNRDMHALNGNRIYRPPIRPAMTPNPADTYEDANGAQLTRDQYLRCLQTGGIHMPARCPTPPVVEEVVDDPIPRATIASAEAAAAVDTDWSYAQIEAMTLPGQPTPGDARVVQFADSLRPLVTVGGEFGARAARALAYVYFFGNWQAKIPLANYYAVLANLPSEDSVDADSEKVRPVLANPVPVGRSTTGTPGPLGPRTKGPAGVTVSVPVPAGQRAKQRDAVIARLATRFRGAGEDEFVCWTLLSAPKGPFAYAVACATWGDGWKSSCWRRTVVALMIAPQPRTRARTIMLGSSGFMSLAVTSREGYEQWVAYAIASEQQTWEFPVLAAECAAHNRAMHAANGNVFSRDMDEVKAAPSIDAVYKTPLSSMPADLLTLSAQIAGSMPLQQLVAQASDIQSTFISDLVTNTNTRVQFVSRVAPEAWGMPRTVRPSAGGALIDSTNQLQVVVLQPLDLPGYTLTPTALCERVVQNEQSAAGNVGRADTMSVGGAMMRDLGYIAKLSSMRPLNVESIAMRAVALSQCLGAYVDDRFFNATATTSAFDPWTRITDAVTAGALTSFGADPAGGTLPFNEDCDAAVAGPPDLFFPFTDDRGSITFHADWTTVPYGAGATAFFIPPSLLTGGSNPQASLAITAALLSDWPFSLAFTSWATTDKDGANPAEQTWCHNASRIYIPGERNLHLVLGRRTSGPPPTSAAAANGMAARQPTWGIQTLSQAANTALQVSYSGAVPTSYYLVEYLWSHLSTAGSTDLDFVVRTLGYMMPLAHAIPAAIERVAVYSTYYPSLMLSVFDNGRPDANQAVSWRASDALGHAVLPHNGVVWPLSPADWPAPSSYVASLDSLGWNRLTMGLASADAAPAVLIPQYASWFLDDRRLYWQTLIARTYAMTTQVHRAYIGMATKQWEDLTNNNGTPAVMSRAYRDLVMSHYCAVIGGGMPVPGRMADALDALYTFLNIGSPCRTLHCGSVFARCFVPSQYNTIYDTVNVANAQSVICPLMADYWLWASARRVPRAWMSLPPQSSPNPARGLDVPGGQLAVSQDGLYIGAWLSADAYAPLNGFTTRDDTDDELWNMRLLVTTFSNNSALRSVNGDVAANTPGLNVHLVERNQQVHGASTNPGISRAALQSTMWIPRVNLNWVKLNVVVSLPHSVAMAQIQQGRAIPAVECWLSYGANISVLLYSGGPTGLTGRWAQIAPSKVDDQVKAGSVAGDVVVVTTESPPRG